MTEKKPFGLIAEFETPTEILQAAQRAYQEGFRKFDVHTPFPVHGMNAAMGLRDSRVPWITLVGGISGLSLALLFEWWVSAVDYPLIIGGKPYFSLPAFIPVAFELTILLASVGTVFGMFFVNRLPMYYHPVLRHPGFRRATDDRFFIAIEAGDPRFDQERTRAFLENLGGRNIAVLEA